MAKVNVRSSTPESFSRNLDRRTIVWDPLHAEMVGFEPENPDITSHWSYNDTILHGDSETDSEDRADADSEMIDNSSDDSREEESEFTDPNNQDEVDGPDNERPVDDEPPPGQAFEEASNDSSDEVPPPMPPSFSPVTGPGQSADVPAAQTAAEAQAAQDFHQNIVEGRPDAIKALTALAVKAKRSPKAKKVLKAIARAKPKARPTTKPPAYLTQTDAQRRALRPGGYIKPKKKPIKKKGFLGLRVRGDDVGEVTIMSGAVTSTVANVISTVLRPVSWVTNEAGAVVRDVGGLIESLGKKL